jgi:sulfate adenylyltransferase
MLTADPPFSTALTVDLRVTPERAATLVAETRNSVSWDLTRRQLCDLELLATGACSPLRGFMTRSDDESVRARMRLADGTFWPMPILLEVTADLAARVAPGSPVTLRDPEGVTLAVLTAEDIWCADGPADSEVPAALQWRIGGRLEVLQLPVHHAYPRLRPTPAQLRARFLARGWSRVLAFHTDGPMHRGDHEFLMRAARAHDAAILLQPHDGFAAPDDPHFYMKVRCYEHVAATYPEGTADLGLVPLVPRGGGAREALWHAIVRKNYGCTHVVVEPEHLQAVADSAPEIGVIPVARQRMTFVPAADRFFVEHEVPPGTAAASLSPAELRAKLTRGEEIPHWFTFPAVVRELRRTHPPRSQQGFTVFFTGLSGSGKSTIANVLLARLMECVRRRVTLLDGDIVRKHLSSELGFSKEHRDLNIRRIGYVASEITKAGAIAICCPIAPYDDVRREVRALVEPHGGFVLTYLATPLETCERRDRKGLYAKARAGTIRQFTGISDPYEPPADAEIAIDTTGLTPHDAADHIIEYLRRERYLADMGTDE